MGDTRYRRIFLAVSGMSPQIITETLYTLIHEKRWVPDEVRLITTEQGRRNAVLQLLEGNRQFKQLLTDYQVSQPVEFTERSITVIKAIDGQILSDLRTPEDNEAAANTICATIREMTSQKNTQLHVSLAGGRKTMGFYAGYALSLFGRPQDSLSHVLVSEHYESNQDFFYPTPQTRIIHGRGGQVLDARMAKVWLAEIPFVRLRERLPKTLLEGTHSFSETVQLAREATESLCLTLYPASQSYSVNGRSGKLSALNMGLLLWVVTRALDGQPPVEPVVDGEYRPADELLSIADQYWLDLPVKTENTLLRSGITQSWLEQNVSRLNNALEGILGPELAERCKLASRSVGGRRVYALPEDIALSISGENTPQAD